MLHAIDYRARRQLLPLCLLLASAQHAGLALGTELGPIIINATRVEKPLDEVPAAVSVVGQDQIQTGAEQLGLDESLDRIPGLFFQNRYNFAQDLRVSIRGFGARSAFGIRGIKIIVDGIPTSLPDGQGSVDGIDIGSARRISVIRGPASSLYGNATGGAILIDTERGTARPFLATRIAAGEYGFTDLQVKTGGDNGDLNYLLNASDRAIVGYRDHSEHENTQVNARIEYPLPASSSLTLVLHHTDQPQANDPGGLTAAEVESDPAQARDANVAFDAGENLTQTRLGLIHAAQLDPARDLETRIYTSTRDFANRLPFTSGGAVELNRRSFGGGVKLVSEGELLGFGNRLLLGFDHDRQIDDRDRFDNLMGITGAQTFAQRERVRASGVYAQNETRLSDRIELTLGLRYDDIEFDIDDDFLGDGDDSGNLGFDQLSPMLGLSWSPDPDTHWYATVSSAFETPTSTEFANPVGGGFNPDLEAQQASSLEIGYRRTQTSSRFELALFRIDVDDELTPFELAAQPGRTFFANAGKSVRDGLELAYARQITDQLELSLAYTYSDFRFRRFSGSGGEVYDGNRIPGIPQKKMVLGLSWNNDDGYSARWETIYTGSLFADNANEVEVDSYPISSLRLGYDQFDAEWEFAAFVGINNLFDQAYNGNVRINAAGGRYFEPAPERNAFAGFTLRRKLDP